MKEAIAPLVVIICLVILIILAVVYAGKLATIKDRDWFRTDSILFITIFSFFIIWALYIVGYLVCMATVENITQTMINNFNNVWKYCGLASMITICLPFYLSYRYSSESTPS